MPLCVVCEKDKPKASETHAGRPLCQDCIDLMNGKYLKLKTPVSASPATTREK